MFKEIAFNKSDANNSNDDFLMTMDDMRYLREGKKTIEKSEKIDRLNKKIDEVVAGGHIEIFKKLAEAKKEGKKNPNLLVEDSDEIFANYSPDTKLIDLPKELLGKILRPMNKEIRQTIFVQRNTMDLEQALRTQDKWTKESVVAYHVSPFEAKNGFLEKQREPAIYFSTDIERLFNRKDSKYIYAFRINKDKLATYEYGGLDCFGRMQMQNDLSRIEIEDGVSIFDPNDPSYRKRMLDNIGAKFAENYHAADDTAAAFLKNRVD